jgi:hypothetical protein
MEPNLTAAKKGGLRYNTCSMLHMNSFLFLKGRCNEKFSVCFFTNRHLKLLTPVEYSPNSRRTNTNME